ncbi:tyrosine-type recombinase/integrase, partial [Chloroflexota bacterium]
MSTQTAVTKLDTYLSELTLQGLSVNYLSKIREFLLTYLSRFKTVSPETAKQLLASYADRKPNTRARYATYLRGFLNYVGMPFNLKVKVPKQLPPFVSLNDIEKLVETIKAKETHKVCLFRDLVLIETACKTGLRRSELANLRVRDINFDNRRLKVVSGKGAKDRVIPLLNDLTEKLAELCCRKELDERVFE